MRADEVGVVYVGIVNVFSRLHLRLQLLHHVPFTNQIMGNLNASNLGKRLGKCLRLVLVRRDGFRYDLNLHACKRARRINKPLHLFHLLCLAQR